VIPERRLLVIRHSNSAPIPCLDAHFWKLSSVGRTRGAALAEALAPHSPGLLATSREPKAQETAEIVGRALGVLVEPVPDLHEHDRTGVPWLGQEQFETAVRTFFDRPHERVFGNESANEALSRFATAVDGVLTHHMTGSVAVVAHGTVISLYVAAKTGIEPFPLWQRLGLPSFVVLDPAGGRLLEIVEQV
jgi:broad specificity phosphatase PhoE